MGHALRMTHAQYEAASGRVKKAYLQVGVTSAAFGVVVPDSSSKPRKFRNTPTVGADGFKYDSRKEARRYTELCLLQEKGEIAGEIERQAPIGFYVNEVHVFDYTADFMYKTSTGARVIEDVKSAGTRKHPVYRLKKKCIEALYGIVIREV